MRRCIDIEDMTSSQLPDKNMIDELGEDVDTMTIAEYYEQNAELKEQLRSQIAIFEQYLLVAKLQHISDDERGSFLAQDVV